MAGGHDTYLDQHIKRAHNLGPREKPNNIEAEQALLGAILVNNAAYDRVKGFLQPEHFYEPLHRKIYIVAGELIEMDKLVTPITIKTFLPANERIGELTVAGYLARLAVEAVNIINTRDYGISIHELWLRRELIKASEGYVDLLYDAPPSVDVLGDRSDFEDRMAQLRGQRVKEENRRGLGARYLERLGVAKKQGKVYGVPIFLRMVHRIYAEPSYAAGNYYGLLGSSGEGKTSYVLQQVLHALENDHPVLIQSYDQTPDQFIAQMIAQRYAIEAAHQRAGTITDKQFESAADFALWLDTMPFGVMQCTDQTAPQLVTKAREFVRRYQKAEDKPALIVTDHVNAIPPEEPPAGSRHRRGRDADEGTKAKTVNLILKSGAVSLDASWLALCQRNSEGMKRPNPRPIAQDVYGGQAALYSYDTMIYLYRYMKYLSERKKVAVKKDWSEIEAVFPAEARGGADLVEVGALKLRFGNVFQDAERLTFEGRYTRYGVPDEAANDQEDFATFAKMA